MKLEYGKRYVLANGEIVGPLVKTPITRSDANSYTFYCPNTEQTWTETGSFSRYFGPTEWNIVREYKENKQVKEANDTTIHVLLVATSDIKDGDLIVVGRNAKEYVPRE